MNVFWWIVLGGILMSAIALVGSITLVLKPSALDKILLPMVALAAGSLIGGAFLHMIPASLQLIENQIMVFILLLSGFSSFMLLEQFLHWHHCHRKHMNHKEPSTYLILIADGLHNFIGGLAVASAFIADIRLGITTWLIAAAHEVPQELGDFAVLVHGGWKKKTALLFNVLSAVTFLAGGLFAYFISSQINTEYLIPFAAGNFIYIGASDLIPEVNKGQTIGQNLLHFLSFLAGILILLAACYL